MLSPLNPGYKGRISPFKGVYSGMSFEKRFDQTLARTGVWRGICFQPRTIKTAEIEHNILAKDTFIFCAKPCYELVLMGCFQGDFKRQNGKFKAFGKRRKTTQ